MPGAPVVPPQNSSRLVEDAVNENTIPVDSAINTKSPTSLITAPLLADDIVFAGVLPVTPVNDQAIILELFKTQLSSQLVSIVPPVIVVGPTTVPGTDSVSLVLYMLGVRRALPANTSTAKQSL